MAFFGRVGNILRQAVTKQICSELCPMPSAFQAIRCVSSAASSKVFVGGLSFATDEQSLREAFANYGEIVDARVIVDRNTGRSRGFGFVTFTSVEEASRAIQALDGQDLHGRRVRLDYATDRPRGFGGGSASGNSPYGAGAGAGYGFGGAYGNSPYGSAGGGGSYGSTGAYGGNVAGGYGGGSYGAGGNYSGSGMNYGNDGNFSSGSNAYGGNFRGSSFGGNNAYDSTGTSTAGGNYSGSELNHGNDVNFASNGGFGDNSVKFSDASGGGGSDNYGSAAAWTSNDYSSFAGSRGSDNSVSTGGSDDFASGGQSDSKENDNLGEDAGHHGESLEGNDRDEDDDADDFIKKA